MNPATLTEVVCAALGSSTDPAGTATNEHFSNVTETAACTPVRYASYTRTLRNASKTIGNQLCCVV